MKKSIGSVLVFCALLCAAPAFSHVKMSRDQILFYTSEWKGERFPDGRLNIVVEGRERFRLVELTRGRSFQTAEIERVGDDEDAPEERDVERALEQFARLRELTSSEVDDPDPAAGFLSFQLAARVDFGAEVKQQLLEQRSEAGRMHVLAELLENAVHTLALEQEVRDRASQNGKVSTD